jgi:hypothetical protein
VRIALCFIGGPRDGRVLESSCKNRYPPRVMPVTEEADAVGMHGVYRATTRKLAGCPVMVWNELPDNRRKDKQ